VHAGNKHQAQTALIHDSFLQKKGLKIKTKEKLNANMDSKKPTVSSPVRMLTREGNLNIEQDARLKFNAYNYLIEISWQRFLLYAFVAYVIINLIFTVFYFTLGGISCLKNAFNNTSAWQDFLSIFFFSTQTFTTVGYGYIYPNCLVSNVIASVESFSGLVFFSVVTGLFFTKFTKPRIEISISEVAVIEYFKEGFGLKFMLANKNKSRLVDIAVTFDLIRLERTEDGLLKKRFYQLFLFRKSIPYLSVPWTVVHAIDTKSPLYELTKSDFEDQHLEFFIQVKAFDETHRQFVYCEFSYFGTKEVLWGHKFVNIQNYTQTGALKLSMKKFGDTTKLEAFPNKIE
jgi:inward rectifier potassium channel